MSQADEIKAPIEDSNIIRSGWLDVDDGHELYWVDWGNKDSQEPIFYLHGGPGAGFDENTFDKFDPVKHRVVFHDQRGSGRSTPFASTENNTTQHLIDDITKLKDHLGFVKISLYGFSWGSTLALMYAIANPSQISQMLIGGIFLARQQDTDFYLRGTTASHFPEAWQRFAAQAPSSQKSDPSEFYKESVFGDDEVAQKKAAKEWMLYEASLAKLDYTPAKLERSLSDFAAESLAYLEAHYILQSCFIEENYILKSADTIKHIPTTIVQGRYDFICMPSAAYELKQALGDKARLHFVMAGHSSSDTVQREVIKAYLSALW